MRHPPPNLHFVLDFVTYFGPDWKRCPAFTSLRTKRKRFTVAPQTDWEFDLKCWPNGNASSGPGKVCVALETLGEVAAADDDDDEDDRRRSRKLPSLNPNNAKPPGKVAAVPVAFLSTVGDASCGWKLKDFTADDTSGWYVVAEHNQISDVAGPDATCLLQIQAWFNPPATMTATIAPENRLMTVRKHICSTAVSSLLDDAKSADLILVVPGTRGQDDFKIHLHRRVLAAKSGWFRALLRSGELSEPADLDPDAGGEIAKALKEHPDLPSDAPANPSGAPPAPRAELPHTVARPHATSLDPASQKYRLTMTLPSGFTANHLLEVLSYIYACCYSLPPTLSITFLISLLDLGHALDVRGLTDVVKWYFATVMEHGLVNVHNVYPLFLCAKRHGLVKLSEKCARFMEQKDRDGWGEDEMDSLVEVLTGAMSIDKEGEKKVKIEEGADMEEFVGLSRSLRDKLAV
ncbi:hypothetical protein DFJ74DRAFT_684959 [Hyaloraphidium curvatum]|nr:hypothetical protein DFJ74DRAFT_684959 [Hyaloraphidium curvatum]